MSENFEQIKYIQVRISFLWIKHTQNMNYEGPDQLSKYTYIELTKYFSIEVDEQI